MRKRSISAFFLLILTSVWILAGINKATIKIREWDARMPDSFPHHPAVAPDGALWYTGMAANTLGRLECLLGAAVLN